MEPNIPYQYSDPESVEFVHRYSVDNELYLRNVENASANGDPKVYLHVIAGLISGPLSRTMTAPIDRLRLKAQIDPNFISISTTIKELYHDGGITGFWRGNVLNVLKVGPEMALRFGFFEKFKALIAAHADRPLSIMEKFLSAAGAGIFGLLAIYPAEVLKTRITIAKTGQYSGTFDAIRQIYKKEGWKSFFRGYGVGAIGTLPYTGIDLTLYETLKLKFVYDKTNEKELTHFEKMTRVMLCAAASTTIGQCSTYPFYLVKTRQQGASPHSTNNIKQPWRLCSICQIFYLILKNEGIPGLYRGILPSIIKVLPAGALNYTIYDFSYQNLLSYYEIQK